MYLQWLLFDHWHTYQPLVTMHNATLNDCYYLSKLKSSKMEKYLINVRNPSLCFCLIYFVDYPTLVREFQGFRVWGKFVFRTLELTDTPTNLANQVKVGHAFDQSRSVQSDLRERTKTMSRHGDRQGQIADFRRSFETINWLYLLFKCGIKTKTHFEWLLWHWFSLGQFDLEPTRLNGLVGCKVPTDFVKISVKEATHMGFYHIPKWL